MIHVHAQWTQNQINRKQSEDLHTKSLLYDFGCGLHVHGILRVRVTTTFNTFVVFIRPFEKTGRIME